MMYQEKLRPKFHFTPKKNWMNDPNGMVYYEGEYHLFFQYHPGSTVWGPMHWGHAISKDLVHWEEQPIALYPDEKGTIFSGSGLVDWNDTTGFFDGGSGLVLSYTYHQMCEEGKNRVETQGLAYSKDKGRTWTKYDGNPVLADGRFPDFRDPKIFWHNESNQWIMSLAVDRVIHFYGSPNLKEWEFLSEFGVGQGTHVGVWECPDLFQLPVEGTDKKKWVLIVSIGNNPDLPMGSKTQYFIGEFDGRNFINDNPGELVLWLDEGRDNYAGVSWSDVPTNDKKRTYIAWMNNWKYANIIPACEWRGMMTLPREITLYESSEGVRIKQQFIKKLEDLREDAKVYTGLDISGTETQVINLPGQACEVNLSFETEGLFEMVVSNEKGEKVTLAFDSIENTFMLDRSESGQVDFQADFAAKHTVKLEDREAQTDVQIYLDTTSIEVLVNDGKLSKTFLIFPEQPYTTLTLSAPKGETKVSEVTTHSIKNIWG